MADLVQELLVKVKFDSQEYDKGLDKVKSQAGSTGNVVDKKLGKSFVDVQGKIREGGREFKKFNDTMVGLTGVTGKLGNALGDVAEGMLTGGYIGLGFAAATAAIELITKKMNEFREATKTAIGKLIEFVGIDPQEKFKIFGEDLESNIARVEAHIDKLFKEGGALAIKNTQIMGGLTDAEEKRLEEISKQKVAAEELLEKLKEQKAQMDAMQVATGIIKENIINTPVARFDFKTGQIFPVVNPNLKSNNKTDNKTSELTTADQVLKKRTDIEKKIADIDIALQNPLLKETQIRDLLAEQLQYKIQIANLDKQGAIASQINKFSTMGIIPEDEIPSERGIEAGTPLSEKAKQATVKSLEDSEKITTEMETSFDSMLNAATSIGSVFGEAGASFVSALQSAYSLASSIVTIITGIVNIASGGAFSFLGAHSGGVFQGGKKIASFAGGGDFVVPSGFSNDSFPMMVESGERVTVTPSGRVGDEAKLLVSIAGKLDALNKNLATKNMSPVINLDIDGKKLVKEVTKPNENRLSKSGFDLNAL